MKEMMALGQLIKFLGTYRRGGYKMTASEALNQMCHTYQRYFDETIYTIEDYRFPEYDGRQISRKLIKGKHICEWKEEG